jgi:hypothetical protein
MLYQLNGNPLFLLVLSFLPLVIQWFLQAAPMLLHWFLCCYYVFHWYYKDTSCCNSISNGITLDHLPLSLIIFILLCSYHWFNAIAIIIHSILCHWNQINTRLKRIPLNPLWKNKLVFYLFGM